MTLEEYLSDPAFMQALHGTAGYITPMAGSAYGNGGGRSTLMGLQDYYNANPVQTGRDIGEDNGSTYAPAQQATPQQLAARAAFEAKYPGYTQLSPEQVTFQNGQVGLKTAGPSVGQDIEDGSKVKYDPEFGYITPLNNDAVAGQAGGWNGWAPLAMLAAGWGAPALGFGADAAAGASIANAGSAVPDSYWSMLAGDAPAGGIGAVGGAADAGGTMTGAFGANAGGTAFGGSLAETPWWAAGGPNGAAGVLAGGAGAVGLGGTVPDAASGLWGGTFPDSGSLSISDILNGGKTVADTASRASALAKALGITQDKASLLGGLGGAALSAYGSDQQANAYRDVANQYLALGAPSRARLEASYAPGFSMADQPDFQNALDIGAQAAARATSAKVGNPTGNRGAYADMQKYISGSLALPQLNAYRSQNATSGGLGVNTAGSASTSAAGNTSGLYNSLGFGLDQITKPDSQVNQTLADVLKKYATSNGGGF